MKQWERMNTINILVSDRSILAVRLFIHTAWLSKYFSLEHFLNSSTVERKILSGENIDEFDEFSAIRQYFAYQNFPFIVSYLPLLNLL